MLKPSSRYPGQVVTTDPDYPHGKARDRGTPGDGTGTPFEKDLVNDIWGFFQAVIVWFGGTPNETPETSANSQVLTGLRVLQSKRQKITATGTWNKPSGPYTWAKITCIAPGSGGGVASTSGSNKASGGGGCSGERREITVAWASIPSSLTATIGTPGTVGNRATATSFGAILTANPGGRGGAGHPSGTAGCGGGGGGGGDGAGGTSGNGSSGTASVGGDGGPFPSAGTGGIKGASSNDGSIIGGHGYGGGGGLAGGFGSAGGSTDITRGGGGGGGPTCPASGVGGGPTGGGVSSGDGAGYQGAGYGGGGGGQAGATAKGGGGGGGWTDIEGFPTSTQSTTGQVGVIVIDYW